MALIHWRKEDDKTACGSSGDQLELTDTQDFEKAPSDKQCKKCKKLFEADSNQPEESHLSQRDPITKAYLRVSTEKQDLEKFKPAIFEFAASKGFVFTPQDIVEEKISGKVKWRERKIGQLIDQLQAGDRLIIPELTRFSRSMTELLEMLQILKTKRVNVYVLKGNLCLNGNLDDPMTDLIVRILSALSEFERDLISMRIKEGLKAKNKSGVKLGRPKGPGKSKLDAHKDEIIAFLKLGVPKSTIARKYDVTPATLFNWIKKNKIDISAK